MQKMEECLTVFEQGWAQLPKDPFLCQAVILLRSRPKVAEFQGLCHAELERVYGSSGIKFPYSVQSGWIHNVRLAKSMVLWVLSGRQSPPQRLSGRGNGAIVGMAVPLQDSLPAPALVPSWEDSVLNMAWQMLQHVLSSPALSLQSIWSQQLPSGVFASSPLSPQTNQWEEQNSRKTSQPQFYPAQVEMAERLFGTLFGHGNGGNIEVGLWPLDQYEEMDFRILLPPSVSLQAQTVQRVREVFGEGVNVDGKVLNRCMFRAGAANADYERLREAVMERDIVSGRKRRLMMIIVDECHLGIGGGGQMDVLVNGALHGATGMECNRERILMEDNVYVVFVSATGWNCLPGVLPEKTVVWNEDPSGYTGWKSYASDNEEEEGGGEQSKDRLCSGEGYQRLLDYFQLLYRKQLQRALDPRLFALLPSLVLMVDYGLAFLHRRGALGLSFSSLLCSVESRQIVNDHFKNCSENMRTTVVRVQQNGAQGAMVRWLCYFLGCHGGGSGGDGARAIRVETSLDGLQKKGNDAGSSFCVLVEKGRYGDSFPGRLMHYDLRARYHRPSCTFSSLLQDVGRCFGYQQRDEAGKGPWIMLNPQGHRLFMGKDGRMVVDRYLNKQGDAHRRSMWWQKTVENENENDKHEKNGKGRERWALLLAQPQVGKTGVYLKLLQMVKDCCRSAGI